MKVRTISLKVGSKTLRLVIHESDNYITLYIGGHTKYCIYGFIIKEGSGVARQDDITIGEFSKIHYNLECSLEHDFKRGVDSNMILKVLLSYISKYYSYVKYLKFDDASYRTCDNGLHVDLAEMTYITTGKTWYEKNFGAIMTSSTRDIFNKAEERFKKSKSETSWDTFCGTVNNDIIKIVPNAKKLYEEAETWQSFFAPVREHMGIEKFCPFVAPWLEQFMRTSFGTKFIKFEYLMPLEPNKIEFTELPYARGGKKFTRKHLKLRQLSIME
jgi:hypothetical protein